ncbi:hypothetical protein [Trujillonella humicola]|uniref:hypothetical protein n=1 Tax=Trujillonella humicola TaxID=3383699 RepID=UPI0039062160
MTATLPGVATASPGTAPARRRRLVLAAAVTGLVAAGCLHLVAAADHVGAGDLAVGFFLLAAAAQLGVAVLFAIAAVTGVRPAPALLAATLAGTVALLGLYVVAHTTGLLDAFAVPHGTGHAGHGGPSVVPQIDPVTGTDLSAGMARTPDGPVDLGGAVPAATSEHSPGATGTAAVTAEVLTVLALTALLPATWRRVAVDGLFCLGVLAWALWFTGVLR